MSSRKDRKGEVPRDVRNSKTGNMTSSGETTCLNIKTRKKSQPQGQLT